MNRRRLLLALWLVVGVFVWNGFFDLYVSRGARYYLQLQAEAELGRTRPEAMHEVMAVATRQGLIAATIWAVVITGLGWITVRVASRLPK